MNSIHFLTTPSQQWEKWLAEFIHTFFIIPIIAIIPVMSAVLIVKLFSFSANNLYISADGLYFAIKKYWIMHPLLFFGAIYFRHSVLIKTFGSIALLAIASGLFVAVLTNLFPAIDHENFALIYSQLPIVHFVTNPLFKIVSTLAYFLFFWGMSYLSLLEIEN